MHHCDLCNYETVSMRNLNIRAKHEEAQYQCKECEYKTGTKQNMKRHVESKHERVRYPCDYCEYLAVERGHLKIHVESILEEGFSNRNVVKIKLSD